MSEILVNPPPNLVSPAQNEDGVPFGNTVLRWDNGVGARSVDFVIGKSPVFSDEGYPQDNGSVDVPGEYGLTGNLDQGTRYYWRARYVNDQTYERGKWSCIKSFVTHTGKPDAPVLSYPDDGANGVGSPVLKWTNGKGTEIVEVYLSADSTFQDGPVASQFYANGLLEEFDTSGLLLSPGIVYYWKVVNKNTAGETSSEVRTFTTDVSGIPTKPGTGL